MKLKSSIMIGNYIAGEMVIAMALGKGVNALPVCRRIILPFPAVNDRAMDGEFAVMNPVIDWIRDSITQCFISEIMVIVMALGKGVNALPVFRRVILPFPAVNDRAMDGAFPGINPVIGWIGNSITRCFSSGEMVINTLSGKGVNALFVNRAVIPISPAINDQAMDGVFPSINPVIGWFRNFITRCFSSDKMVINTLSGKGVNALPVCRRVIPPFPAINDRAMDGEFPGIYSVVDRIENSIARCFSAGMTDNANR